MSNDHIARELGKAVSGIRCTNWRNDGPPPLIVNPQADHHALLAWCWGEARQIEMLCRLNLGNDDCSAADMADVLVSSAMALTALLEHIVQRSNTPGGASVRGGTTTT